MPQAQHNMSTSLGFRALTSWSYLNHATNIGAVVFPANSLIRAIKNGITNISAKAYMDIYNKLCATVEGTPQYFYKVIAEVSCDSSPPFPCGIPNFTWYNAIGNTDIDILPDASSIAANEGKSVPCHKCLVRRREANIFTNTTSFQTVNSRHGLDQYHLPRCCRLASKGMAYVNSTHPPPPNVHSCDLNPIHLQRGTRSAALLSVSYRRRCPCSSERGASSSQFCLSSCAEIQEQIYATATSEMNDHGKTNRI
ncbi:hypothetical protein B0H14DRAFT_3874426 [Mycena olivaceomarginata]|nr:hypothetical protein B0H14DRAFT_3874426 [Mycena olivaceomarginata]